MSWESRKNPVDDPIAEFKGMVEVRLDTTLVEVTDVECVNSVAYMAVRVNDDPPYVTAVMIPFYNDKERGFGYRIMGEEEEPVYCECPDRIMKQLSPVKDLPDPKSCRNWRRSVERERRAAERETPSEKRREREPSDRDR